MNEPGSETAEAGLVPLLGLSVALLDERMAAAGWPRGWDAGLSHTEKARLAGLVGVS